MSNLNAQLEDLYNELNVKVEEWQDATEQLGYMDENKDEWIDEAEFENFLDEVNEVVSLEGMDFYPSQILKRCDPIAFREGYLNYCDSIDITEHVDYRDLEREIEGLDSEIEDLKAEIENLEEIISEAEVYA